MNNKSTTILAASLLVMLSTTAPAQEAESSSAIPRNWRETLNVVNGNSAASEAARTMRDEALKARNSQFDGVSPINDAMANAQLEGAAARSGINAAVIDAGEGREARLKEIEDGLSKAEDGEDLAELNARAQIENGRMLNELLKLQAANQLIETKTTNATDETMRSLGLQMDYGD
ncbi:type IV secretion system protein [Pinirhizobacter sp.]|jgi:hypothetical protein|uniref:type IV secretion system protein n=1 Tax=Pinirhizobacter sp. TaxID=2950432 RepID=UPI002F41A39F